MSNHTPGPWSAHRSFPHYVVPLAHADRRVGAAVDKELDRATYATVICAPGGFSRERFTKDEIAANTRLIAAAPELLDVADGLLAVAQVGVLNDPEWFGRIIGLARAATKKARGES